MSAQLAIITGASSGLGQTFAQHLAQQGWDLFLTGRRTKRLQSIQTQLKQKHGIQVHIQCANLLKAKELQDLIDKISQLQRIDMLINNAGFGNRNDFYKASYNEQNQMLQVHITAAARIIHAVVPKMKHRKKGAIINVSSLCAYMPAPLSYFYCSSKAFLVSLSECMHIDLQKHNISVQALCPGFIETEFHSRMGLITARSWLEQKLLWMKENDVVSKSLRHLSSNKVICIPGFINKFIYHSVLFLPKCLYYKISAIQSNKLKTSHLIA
ncbi:SDR family NAD(P)-dependent oxidoreductase [Carboxylicivirga marina]|uniref:SDR family NAD(P)-dependent oxidoreductase n=1 Tax=Carboxylicivirga marina TaxID=2800988 RepID=UPI002599040B|nr:SDR family oxidoreductase [uncultured Carboxylicivirga sp.]